MTGIVGLAAGELVKGIAGKALTNAKNDALAAGRWLSTLNGPQLFCLILGILLAAQTVRIDGLKIWPVHISGLNGKLADATKAAADARSALVQTVANYRAAAARAAKDDAANKARVETQQAAISKEQSDEYEARIAAARALAGRLQHELAASANSGSTAKPAVPGIPVAPIGPDQAAGEDGFSVSDRLTATEQAIQLDELIKWVQKQHAVDVNGNPPPARAAKP